MNQLLDQVAFGLENFPKRDEESFGNYFKRLLSLIQKNQKWEITRTWNWIT